jgi:chaperonin cofactor prefoldin
LYFWKLQNDNLRKEKEDLSLKVNALKKNCDTFQENIANLNEELDAKKK